MDRKIALDLPLDERGGHAKFVCTDSYRDQMTKMSIFEKSEKNFSGFSKTGGGEPPSPLSRVRGSRLDLPPDLRIYHAKFGCTGSYRDQMHKEQTDRQTFFFIY